MVVGITGAVAVRNVAAHARGIIAKLSETRDADDEGAVLVCVKRRLCFETPRSAGGATGCRMARDSFTVALGRILAPHRKRACCMCRACAVNPSRSHPAPLAAGPDPLSLAPRARESHVPRGGARARATTASKERAE